MSNPSKKNQVFFVKYPLCLSYLFSPTETRFIAHMIDAEFLKSYGYDTAWSRREWMRRMGLTEYSFDGAVKSLMKIGLLIKRNNDFGNRVYYTFNMELYDKLVSILSVTNNVDRLISFCEMKFRQEKRTIESITPEEISELKQEDTKALKKKHKSM